MVNIDIVNYLKEGMKRGFSIGLLKQKLLEGGFDEFSVSEAIEFVKSQEQRKRYEERENKAEIRETIERRESLEKQEGELGFFKKIGYAISNPNGLFTKTQSENIWDALKYNLGISIFPFAVSFLLSVFLFSFFMYLFGNALSTLHFSVGGLTSLSLMSILFIFVVTFFVFFILVPIGNFVVSFIIHGLVRAYGGREKYVDTYKTIVYSSTPSVILGFIPFVNIVIPIWSLVLATIGLAMNQNMTKGRAFLSLITIPMMIVVAFLTYAILNFFF